MRSLRSSGPRKRLKFPFVIRQVVGDSMLPTLHDGRVIIGRRTGKFRAGDIVLVRHEALDKIKRIGWIDDEALFIVGDNPAASRDSRQFGPIARQTIVAKVIFPRRPGRLRS